MSQILGRINAFLAPHKMKIFIGLFVLVMFFIAKYVWTNYGLINNKNEFKDVANANKNVNRIDIYYFYADWCPHCKNARPEWDKFKQEYGNGKRVGSALVYCKEMDCSDSTQADTYKTEYGVESYPTIKVYMDKDFSNPIEYDAKITNERLIMMMNEISNV